MPSYVAIEFFPNRIDNLINTPDGPVGERTRAVAVAVVREAKKFITHNWPRDDYGKTAEESEPLANTGRVRPQGGNAHAAEFTSPHALVHHQGRGAQTGNTEKGYYIYKGQSGQLVHATKTGAVSPNPYLVKAARKLGIRSSQGSVAGQQEFLLSRLRGQGGRFTPFL